MKPTFISMALVFCILAASSEVYGQSDSLVLDGPYLGQAPPGLIPQVFAPGIVSTAHVDASGFFSPDMNEFYLTRKGGNHEEWALVVLRYEHNRWRESFVAPRVGRPTIAPDGMTMHLGTRYMERTTDGWSEVRTLGPPLRDMQVMRLSASAMGTYYFDEATADPDGSLRYSRLVDGKREEPRLLSQEINAGRWNAHPFIAPDESYLIWDSEREGGYGDSDLYISFRQHDGSWGAAINFGSDVNTGAWEASASVTPDGEYLLFNRAVGPENVDIFWVDAQIIETLRPRRETSIRPRPGS